MALSLSFSVACVLLLSLTVLSSADYYGEKSIPTPKPKSPKKESLLSSTIGIQGMVYCKSNQATKPVPLEGNTHVTLPQSLNEVTDLGSDNIFGPDARLSILALIPCEAIYLKINRQ